MTIPSSHRRGNSITLTLKSVEVHEQTTEGYRPIELRTNRGRIDCRLYEAPEPQRGLLLLGGLGGGYESPGRDLYGELCETLAPCGVACLRLAFRLPGDLVESTLDALAGLAVLRGQGVGRAAVLGYSFGGAVALQAAARDHLATAVVTIASQAGGTGAAAALSSDCALLALHGEKDEILPSHCSEVVYDNAHEPKRLLVYRGAGHDLRDVGYQLESDVRDWLDEHLFS